MTTAQEIINTKPYSTIFKLLVESTGAQPTNRVTNDYNEGSIEWDETATLEGEKVRITYLTDAEDAEIAGETGDWDHVNWAEAVIKIEVID